MKHSLRGSISFSSPTVNTFPAGRDKHLFCSTDISLSFFELFNNNSFLRARAFLFWYMSLSPVANPVRFRTCYGRTSKKHHKASSYAPRKYFFCRLKPLRRPIFSKKRIQYHSTLNANCARSVVSTGTFRCADELRRSLVGNVHTGHRLSAWKTMHT